MLALEDTDEGVLNNVFGFGRVAQDGERDAVEEGRVIADKRGEVGLSYIVSPAVSVGSAEALSAENHRKACSPIAFM